jgi:riboflavin synthase
LGESIAVQGVCLTVASAAFDTFACDLLEETRQRTALGRKVEGSSLNLERAVKAGGRFGGHFVSGHVDGTATVDSVRPVGRDWALSLRVRKEAWTADIIAKGSVSIDGVSLTVVDVATEGFVVHCIPHTWGHTTLSTLRAGDTVNIETDMIGKYVRQFLATADHAADHLTPAALISAGF